MRTGVHIRKNVRLGPLCHYLDWIQYFWRATAWVTYSAKGLEIKRAPRKEMKVRKPEISSSHEDEGSWRWVCKKSEMNGDNWCDQRSAVSEDRRYKQTDCEILLSLSQVCVSTDTLLEPSQSCCTLNTVFKKFQDKSRHASKYIRRKKEGNERSWKSVCIYWLGCNSLWNTQKSSGMPSIPTS